MRERLTLLLALAASVAVTGCGDGDEASGADGGHVVSIGDRGFHPRELTIDVGDRVRFVNRSDAPQSAQTPGVDGAPGDGPTDHSGKDVNYGTARGFATHALFPDEGQTVVFRAARRYPYYSTFDRDLRGVVVVRATEGSR